MKMNCWICGEELEVPEDRLREFKVENPNEEPLAACGKISCSPYFQAVMGNYLKAVKAFSDSP